MIVSTESLVIHWNIPSPKHKMCFIIGVKLQVLSQ